jgi:protein-disulfide isomerase
MLVAFPRPSPDERSDFVAQNSSGPILVAALVLGAALLGSALLLRAPIERTATEVAGLREALVEMAGGGNAAPPERQARRGPDPNRRYAVDTSGAPVKGDEDARLAIVEFSDFQCPFCSRVAPTLQQIEKEYGDQVRIVFKHLPLSIHPKAPAAHAAAEAAHRQGKFWEMHDLIFADQRNMSEEKYLEYAQQIGLDVEQFKKDVASDAVQQKVQADMAEAAKLGVTGTPAFFVNGRFISGAQPFATFQSMIDEELGKG